MADYIRREDALKGVELFQCGLAEIEAVQADYIERLPAADVAPVVRCKKCAHARPTVRISDGKQAGIWCSYHDIVPVAADDFCSYGRKQNEGEVEHDS